MEDANAVGRLAKTVRTGGYIIEAGSILGFSIGILFLLNHSLFGNLFRIGQSEVTAYFIGIFMPSFVILAIFGYLFITPLGLKKAELSSVVSICVVSFLVTVLSAFSILYFISLFGGLIVLTASVRAYTKPTFKTLSKRETFFLVEIGALLVASFSTLFLVMYLGSSYFQTYSPSLYGNYPIYTLLAAMLLSFLTFFGVPLLGSRGMHAGVSGTLGLATTILSFVFIYQNQYVFSNISAVLGMSMLFIGISLLMVGNLGYIGLFLSEIVTTEVFSVSPLERGKYCPYCGKPRSTAVQSLCSFCGRSLTWTPYAPYCASCGLLVPEKAKACPHCKEDLSSKRIYFYGRYEKDRAVLDKVSSKLEPPKTWAGKISLRVRPVPRRIGNAIQKSERFIAGINQRLSLSLLDVALIVLLCYVFNFVSFVASIPRADFVDLGFGYQTVAKYMGFPFEWLQLKMAGFPPTNIIWTGLFLDIILYLLLATFLVSLFEKVRLHFR